MSESVVGSSSPVVAATVALVERFGPDLVGDGGRVRAGLNDLLGADARRYRGEVDAVAIVGEEVGLARLLGVGEDDADVVRTLESFGLAPGTTSFALATWRRALGAPPTADRTIPASGLAAFVTVSDHTVSDPAPPPGADPMIGELPPAPPSVGTHRRAVAVIGILGLVALLGAAFVLRARDDRPSTPASSGPADGSVDVETRGEPAVVGTFDPGTTGWGAGVTRTWAVEEGAFTGELRFTNHRSKAIAGRYEEVVPSSLAATADEITTRPKAKVTVDGAPVLAWQVRVPAREAVVVRYVIEVDEGAGQEDLDAWRKDWKAAVAEHKRDKTPAGVELLSPGPGQTVDQPSVMVVGRTDDPKARITVNGTPARVQADGGFSAQITLVLGTNRITGSSVDGAGNELTVFIDVIYAPPAPPPSGGGSTAPSTGGGGGGGTSPAPDPSPAPNAADSDGDGFPDPSDRCPTSAGIAAHRGCPAPTLTVTGPPTVYALSFQAACDDYSWGVRWTGGTSPESITWSSGGTTYRGFETIEGIGLPTPGRYEFRVDAVFDGVSYGQQFWVDAVDYDADPGSTSCNF